MERVANKHVSFNVVPEQYDVVGGILLEALEVSFHFCLFHHYIHF